MNVVVNGAVSCVVASWTERGGGGLGGAEDMGSNALSGRKS